MIPEEEDRGSSWGINRMQSPTKSTVTKIFWKYFSSAVMRVARTWLEKSAVDKQTDRH